MISDTEVTPTAQRAPRELKAGGSVKGRWKQSGAVSKTMLINFFDQGGALEVEHARSFRHIALGTA